MPFLNKLLHKGDREKSPEKNVPSAHVEHIPSQSSPTSPTIVNEAPPGYTAADGHAETDLAAAFANLNVSQSNIPAFPNEDLCLAHLKLLKTFHNLKEDVGYADGLFGLWDARCELPVVENRDKALVAMREKRWSLYIARAVERFEYWWLKVLCEQEYATRLQQKDMTMPSDFIDFPKKGVAKAWSTSMLPPIDVLMVWHSLMLNPRNYLEDCMRFGLKDLWATGMPWHAVNTAIDTNFSYQVPEAAKERFTNATGHHWSNANDHPAKTLNCPRCSQLLEIPWTTCAANEKPSLKEIMEMNGTGYGDRDLSHICHKCNGQINHDLLRVAKFKREVENLIMRDYPLGGTILSPSTGIPDAPDKKHGGSWHQNSFPNRMITVGLKVKMLELIDRNPDTKPAMTDVRDLIEETFKSKSALKKINNGRSTLLRGECLSVRKMMSRYWQNSSIFALELGGAVIRQSVFVGKMANLDWLHSPAADTSASDPRLLVHIKSYRNVVPVPNHWSLKREYLSSKRGVEKAPFSLPKFIQETGIAEMRDAVLEKQDGASLKQKQRERVQPKMGKLDIDYQKLYEAFFRFQTKPELTRYGEVYYEGKEYETNLRHLRPGELSDDLKDALNIPPGAPPPWLINQQRFGPPPSYPSLKIPGLNAPPPPGGAWGFHPGGYGKPPVDEFNRPLYGGDIFGVLQPQVNNQAGEPIERTLWGELQAPEEESEEEEESDEEEEEGDEEDVGGLQTPSGTETPGGMASTVPSEYPGEMSVGGDFDLRKQKRGTETEESTHPRSAYTVIPERQIRAEGFFGGERAYDVRAGQNAHLPVLGQEDTKKRKKPGDVDVALDPDSLQNEDGISKEEVKRRFEAQKKEERGAWQYDEDLSDMIAQESRKKQKRDEEKRGEKRERSYRF